MNRTQISLQQSVGKTITGYAVSRMGGMLLMAVGDSEFVEFVADGGDYEWVISGNVGSFCADYYELEELAKVFDADTVQAMRDDRARREAERVLWIAQEQQRREAAAREPAVDRTCKGHSRADAWMQEHRVGKYERK